MSYQTKVDRQLAVFKDGFDFVRPEQRKKVLGLLSRRKGFLSSDAQDILRELKTRNKELEDRTADSQKTYDQAFEGLDWQKHGWRLYVDYDKQKHNPKPSWTNRRRQSAYGAVHIGHTRQGMCGL